MPKSKNELEQYELKPGQIQAAAMLAEGATFEEAGHAINLSPATLRNWMKTVPEFKTEVERRARESADRMQMLAVRARLEIMDMAPEAGKTIRDAMNALNNREEPNWAIRLKAAELVLKHGVPDSADGTGDRAQAQAAVMIITNDDVAVARKMTSGGGEIIEGHLADEEETT